ncbi:MAG: hypothetical protein CMO29_23075 [Tistrella sp.]|nr:hypothetical protein [Tistrella sp.]
MTLPIDVLPALAQRIPRILGDVSGLGALMSALPPVLTGGFECRLSGASRQVDLQLCLLREDPLSARLEPALRSALHRLAPPGAVPDGLDGLLADWRRTTRLVEIWLEFDPVPGGFLPSVFLGFPPAGPDEDPASAMGVVAVRLTGRQPDRLVQLVTALRTAVPGAFPSHLGLMLGRPGGGMRLNIKRLQGDMIAPTLEAIGWPGDLVEAVTLGRALLAVSDRVTLAVDLDPARGVLPAIGFECVAEPRLPHPPLALMTMLGLADVERRGAVEAWPGRLSPDDIPWPAELIRADLLEPDAGPGVLNLGISHIKVARDAAGQMAAKAYLWFGHGREEAPHRASVDWEDPAGQPILERTRRYFRQMTPAYLHHLGTTFRAFQLGSDGDVRRSNLAWAQRAGLAPGMRVLDAGCGVGGPAMDLARDVGAEVWGLTLMPDQAALGRRLVMRAGLSDRVRLVAGDYHHPPWPDGFFDAVVFFESSNHTDDPTGLFCAMHRILRPGGILYISDCFTRPVEMLDAEGQAIVDRFDRVNADRTRTLSQTAAALHEAGFEGVSTADLTGMVSTRRWRRAYVREAGPAPVVTDLGGLYHLPDRTTGTSPIFCGEVRALKP